MPGTRIELVHALSTRDFKSLASTNSATQAHLYIMSIIEDSSIIFLIQRQELRCILSIKNFFSNPEKILPKAGHSLFFYLAVQVNISSHQNCPETEIEVIKYLLFIPVLL